MHATVVIEAKYAQTQAAMVLNQSDCDYRDPSQSITLDSSIGTYSLCSTDVSRVHFNFLARLSRGHPLSVLCTCEDSYYGNSPTSSSVM